MEKGNENLLNGEMNKKAEEEILSLEEQYKEVLEKLKQDIIKMSKNPLHVLQTNFVSRAVLLPNIYSTKSFTKNVYKNCVRKLSTVPELSNFTFDVVDDWDIYVYANTPEKTCVGRLYTIPKIYMDMSDTKPKFARASQLNELMNDLNTLNIQLREEKNHFFKNSLRIKKLEEKIKLNKLFIETIKEEERIKYIKKIKKRNAYIADYNRLCVYLNNIGFHKKR